jgi:hypothetical protein
MPDYRVYLITEDNHIASAPIKIACDDDLMAVRQSQKLLDHHDIQLWEGRRLVTRIKATLLPGAGLPARLRADDGQDPEPRASSLLIHGASGVFRGVPPSNTHSNIGVQRGFRRQFGLSGHRPKRPKHRPHAPQARHLPRNPQE